ncbi:hypothetical protein [Sphingomonas sp.]|uniref:hypothetical protein n=1 Tax=Sphingomonas sp. TaxID=28214 RepID=UPI003BA9B9D1
MSNIPPPLPRTHSMRLRQLARMLVEPADELQQPSPQVTGPGRPADDGHPRSALERTSSSTYHPCGRTSRFAAALGALASGAAILCVTFKADAQPVSRGRALAAAIHPVADPATMHHWLGRVPRTRDFPSDLDATLRSQASLYVVEMTTAPGCVPCADLWGRLQQLRARFGVELRTISGQDALLRSGKLGLPWVGHPVAWVRPRRDPDRMIPIAVGTDHAPNLTRNLYLAAKMLTGVRPAVAVRAMSKFTGIVGAPAPASRKR